MTNSEHEINYFASTVRQLILKYQGIRKELDDVKVLLKKREQELHDTELMSQASQRDYDMLKAAKMLEVGDGDIDKARKRINKLIRDVDKCITLLSEQHG